MSEVSERQVLYALVAAGFLAVVLALIVVAATSGLSPAWWTVTVGSLWGVGTVYSAVRWKATGRILMVAIGTLVIWTIGTLLTR